MSTGNYESSGCVPVCGGPVPDAGLLSGLGDLGGRILNLKKRYRTAYSATVYSKNSSGRLLRWAILPAGTLVSGTAFPAAGWVEIYGWLEPGGTQQTPPYPYHMREADLRDAHYGVTQEHARGWTGFGDTDASPDDGGILATIARWAVPIALIATGVYVGNKLLTVANRPKRRRNKSRRRNPPYRVAFAQDFDLLPGAQSTYKSLPAGGYASIRDLGRSGTGRVTRGKGKKRKTVTTHYRTRRVAARGRP